MPLRLEQLTSSQVKQLSTRQTVFLFPIAGLDDFGPHLPMGTGLLQSQQLSWQLGLTLENRFSDFKAVLMPPLALASDSATRSGVNVRGICLKDALLDQTLELTRQGFKNFVAITFQAGPRTLTAIEEAGSTLRKRQVLKRFFGFLQKQPEMATLVSSESYLLRWNQIKKAPVTRSPDEHGGATDTAFALWLSPQLVDPMHLTLPRAQIQPYSYRSGYWGDPSQTSQINPETLFHDWIELRLSALHEVWTGKNPESLFRSWYSVIPLNRTLFSLWIWFFILLGLFASWLNLSFG